MEQKSSIFDNSGIPEGLQEEVLKRVLSKVAMNNGMDFEDYLENFEAKLTQRSQHEPDPPSRKFEYSGAEEWQRKEVERLNLEATRDKRLDLENYGKEFQALLAQCSQDQINEGESKGMKILEDMYKEIIDKDVELLDKDVELFDYAKKFTGSRPASSSSFLRMFCHSCELEIPLTDSFYVCVECQINMLTTRKTETGGKLELDSTETGGKLDLDFITCHACYLHKAEHPHNGLVEFTFKDYHLHPVFPYDLHHQRILLQTLSKEKVTNLRFTDYRNVVQMKDDPLSRVLNRYLDNPHIDLSQHRFFPSIRWHRSYNGDDTSIPRFRMLQNLAITFFLIADHNFFERTKILSFLGLLSPIQRASIQLLKEWWLSEIQDPKLMMFTIASYITDCWLSEHDRFTHWFFNKSRNQYHNDYHGAMEKLFDAEFGTFENGMPSGASANLFFKRTQAGKAACIQRMAYLASHPSMNPPWWNLNSPNDLDFERAVLTQCYRWRLNVRLACFELLLLIRLIKGPEEECWNMIDMATEPPIVLFVANHLFNEQIFGPKRLSATLAPLPWLTESYIYDSFPHFLWDVRDQRTIETTSLGFRPQYIAVSHTWGRWKRHSEPSLKIPGVPWLVPQNDLWDVLTLPQQLRKIPGRYRFVWFDLVCIPQDVEPGSLLLQIERDEISKQAAIFSNAARATMWLSTVEAHEFEQLRATVIKWALLSGKFWYRAALEGDELDELERLHPNLFSNTYHIRKDWRSMSESVPLVCKDRRSLIGTDADPIEYIHPWFTSLWTLQELCMRPDMWVCQRDWTPLRIHDTEFWQYDQNLAFDSILALIERFKDMDFLDTDLLGRYVPNRLSDPDWSPLNRADAEAQEAQANIEGKAVRRDYFYPEMSANPEIFNDDSGKLTNNKWISVEEAMRTGYAPGFFKARSLVDLTLYGMLCGTGMDHLLFISPMDILVLADRRQCKKDKNRAEAIMSAIGAVEWYRDTATSKVLVHNRYPISFLTEVRAKVGDGEFFRSRFLNYAALKIAKNFDKTGELPSAAGTVLPFGVDSTFDVAYSQLGIDLDPVQQESHPSLQTWRIQLDASVTLTKVGILASTQNKTGLYECLDLAIEEVGVYHKQKESGTPQKGQYYLRKGYFDGHPEKWLNERQDRCYLVSVDWLQRNSNFSTGLVAANISRGLVLRELKPGYLVKIGSYIAKGHKEHIFPQSEEVEWTIL